MYITKKNSGLATSRNTGLKNSTSEFFTCVDSDDTVDINAYEKAIEKITDDVDFLCFGIQSYGSQSEKAQKADDEYYAVKFNGKTQITEEVLAQTDVSSCNKIFRKPLVEKFNLSYPDGLRYY